MNRVWKWAHRRAIWRLVNSTHTSHGWTRSAYHSRLPLPIPLVRLLAQRTADRDNRQVFVQSAHRQPRYKGLRAWEVKYR
jgi:hypothetical protein